MKTRSINACLTLLVMMLAVTMAIKPLNAQQKKEIIFDTFHGQSPRNAEVFSSLLPKRANAAISVNSSEINDETLRDKEAIVLFSLTKPLAKGEKQAITKYLRSGGSMLLIFDEERRTSLNGVGINDVIAPFGISLTADAPVRHNCGAIAEKSEVCAGKRELPYSGGRSVKGGTVISKVNDEGNYVHSAYTVLPDCLWAGRMGSGLVEQVPPIPNTGGRIAKSLWKRSLRS
jgi:hypothetical protein